MIGRTLGLFALTAVAEFARLLLFRLHLSLRVESLRLDALVDFYARVFGEAPRKRYPDFCDAL